MAIKNFKLRIKNWRRPVRVSFIIFPLSFLIFPACSYKKEIPPPPDLIDQQKMALVITDLSLTESALTNEPLANFNDTLKKVNVLKEYNVSYPQFLSSMKYYSENPQNLKDIYDTVLIILNARLGVVDTVGKK